MKATQAGHLKTERQISDRILFFLYFFASRNKLRDSIKLTIYRFTNDMQTCKTLEETE